MASPPAYLGILGEPARWGRRPPEIEHELRVWLAMPGFHPTYHAHVLGLSLYSIRKHIGGYEEMAEEVAENWLSATRDDCVRLSRLRPHNASVPLLCQIRAVQDLKKMRAVDVARDYHVTDQSLRNWSKRGFNFPGHLPSGFATLVY